MSGNFKYLFMVGHDTLYLENGMYFQLTKKPLGVLPPGGFI